MNLIVNKVMQLEVVHVTDGYGVIEQLAGSAVPKLNLAAFIKSCLSEQLTDIAFARTVKNRCHNVPAKLGSGSAEMNLKHLTDIHTGRNTQRVKQNIQRSAVRKEGHIFLRKDS